MNLLKYIYKYRIDINTCLFKLTVFDLSNKKKILILDKLDKKIHKLLDKIDINDYSSSKLEYLILSRLFLTDLNDSFLFKAFLTSSKRNSVSKSEIVAQLQSIYSYISYKMACKNFISLHNYVSI